jgi:hypothetical protein
MRYTIVILVAFVPSLSFAQTLHIVAAGVDVYREATPDPWGNQAKNVSNIIAKHSGLTVRKHLFSGKDATKEHILDTLHDLKVSPYDQVFIYIGTHGGAGKKNGFVMMTSGSKGNPKRLLTGKELSTAVNNLPCRVIVAVDACHSAALLHFPMPRAIVMCACQKEEESFGNHFAASIRKGIVKGEADLNRDGQISFSELADSSHPK